MVKADAGLALVPLAIVIPAAESAPLLQDEVPEVVVHIAVAVMALTGTVAQFVKPGELTATDQAVFPAARVNFSVALADPATVALVSGSGAVKEMVAGVTLWAETVIGWGPKTTALVCEDTCGVAASIAAKRAADNIGKSFYVVLMVNVAVAV
jgi:hypothetical protein